MSPASVQDLNFSKAVSRALANFVDSVVVAFGADLRSVVLYGSGAEGRLRPASDVNVVLVLASFDAAKAASIRESFAAAHAAIRLSAMFLLDSEVESSIECFAQKFSDIIRRHRVLYGPDPFEGRSVPRAAVIARLKQVLLNLTLRLREAYVERGTTPERISDVISDAAGPLRSCAATLLEVEGKPSQHPKEALASFVAGFGESGWDEVLRNISETRDRHTLSASAADTTLVQLIQLAARLRARVELADSSTKG
jgi:predicted nucleotidyltransferase